MKTGLFISGSGTDVGKTYIACHIIKILSAKFKVVARKPLESDCTPSVTGLIPKDATLLNNACQTPEALDAVCPFRFAARASGEKASADATVVLSLTQLSAACQTTDFVVIEGAGGLYSPIAKQVLNSDLVAILSHPLVLVVKDELGAVNQALLCLSAAEKQKLTVAMLVLNQITPNTLENAKTIKQYTQVPVVVFSTDNLTQFTQKIIDLV